MNKYEKDIQETLKFLDSRLSIIKILKKKPQILELLDKEDRFHFLNLIKNLDFELYGIVLSEFYQIKLLVDIIRLNFDENLKIKGEIK